MYRFGQALPITAREPSPLQFPAQPPGELFNQPG
jgi:hypothetical protein